MTRVDILLAQIERTLAECDAKTLPPLTSEPAAVVLDLMGQVGLEVTSWQESFVRQSYADPLARPRPRRPAPPLTVGKVAELFDVPMGLVDTRLPVPARRRPWWRRRWFR